MSKEEKSLAKQYDCHFDDFREIIEKETEKPVQNRLKKLQFRKNLGDIFPPKFLMDFEATNLYTPVMWDEKSTYLKTETGYDFTADMNDEIVETFNAQTVTKSSAILEVL